MTDVAGTVYREALMDVESVTVKEDTDITKGMLICDDGSGNGFVPATQALLKTGLQAYMAMETHDYSEETTHTIRALRRGFGVLLKVSGSGAAKIGQKITVSTTAGYCTVFSKGTAPDGSVSTYYTETIEAGVQTALDTNLTPVGDSQEVTEDSDTTQRCLIGA